MSFCLYVHSIEPYLKLASKIHFFRLIVFCGPNVKIRKTNCFFLSFFQSFFSNPDTRERFSLQRFGIQKKIPLPGGEELLPDGHFEGNCQTN